MQTWYTSVKKLKKPKKERVQNLVMTKCIVCGATFQASRAHARSCSARCRQWWHRNAQPIEKPVKPKK